MAKVNLCLHIYVEVPSEATAQQLAHEIVEKLQSFAPVEAWEVEPYWKIPAYYGLTLRFASVREPETLLRSVIGLADSEWNWSRNKDDPEAIWSATSATVFLSSKVKWAHLYTTRIADHPRFSLNQKVRVTGDNPALARVRGHVGEVVALPSEDEMLIYAVAFKRQDPPNDYHGWCIAEADLEPASET